MRVLGYIRKTILAAAMLCVAGQASALGLQDTLNGALASGLAQTLQVEGKASITAVTGTCPNVVLTMAGIPVTVNASTTFPTGQTCGQLIAGTTVEVRGTLTITGTTLSVVATMVDIEDGLGEGKGEGRVTDVQGTCPNLTITVDGITVKADALTKYVPVGPAAGCALIKVGTKIEVKAVPVAGGGFRARTIEIKGQRHFGEGDGRITAVAGACPDVTISFGSTDILVNAATTFSGGTCADLAPGVKVHAKGFKDDGATANVASFIKFVARHVEGRSVVTKVTGTCPTLAITVGGVVKVVTDANTVFVGGSCATIRTGVKVHVKGDMQNADGAVIAEQITIEDQPGGNQGGRIEGTITAATGTCPALTLTVKGITVKTTASTKFDNIACSALAVNTKVEVEGDLVAGVLTATKIELED